MNIEDFNTKMQDMAEQVEALVEENKELKRGKDNQRELVMDYMALAREVKELRELNDGIRKEANSLIDENMKLKEELDAQSETKVTENTFFSKIVELRKNVFDGEPTAHNLINTSVLEERDDESLEFHAVLDNKLIKIWDKEEGFING